MTLVWQIALGVALAPLIWVAAWLFIYVPIYSVVMGFRYHPAGTLGVVIFVALMIWGGIIRLEELNHLSTCPPHHDFECWIAGLR